MKKLYLLAITIALSTTGKSQTISESFNPKPGNKYTSYIYQNKDHDVGTKGVNQTYDFTDLGTQDALGSLSYENAVGNPNNPDFPESNVLSVDESGNFVYYKTSSSSNNVVAKTITYEGSSNDIPFSNMPTITLPINYNSLKTDQFKGETSVISSGLSVKIYREGVDSVLLDSYGTLKLNGVTKKVNRLRIISNYSDSAKYLADVRRKNLVRNESYYYIGENEDYPTVVVTKVRTNAILQTSSSVTEMKSVIVYKPGTLNTNKKNIETDAVSVWSYSKGEVVLKGLSNFDNQIAINIYDLTGKILFSENLSNEDLQTVKFSLNSKENKMIFISLSDSKRSVTKKLLY